VAVISEPKKTVEVFFSYSHRDQDLRAQLETHLSLLKHQGIISSWHDRKIIAGTEWAREIDEHLNTAQIILLLISADFLASSYCYDIEVMRAMERHNAGEARVIPIILRHCDWNLAPFGKLQALPTDGKPVDSRNWYNKDEAFHNIAQGIRKAVEDLPAFKTSAKVQGDRSRDFSKTDEKLTLPKAKVKDVFNPYKVRDEWIEYISSNLREAIEGEDSLDFYSEDVEGQRQIRILRNQDTIYSLNIKKGGFGSGDAGISFSYATGRMISISGGINAWGQFKWDAAKDLVVLELHDISLLSSFISGDAKEYTKEEFLAALWNKIRSVIENSFR